MDSLLLDFDEVARLIVFSPATVANWAYRRKPAPQGFPTPVKVGRILRYRRTDIEGWIARLGVAALVEPNFNLNSDTSRVKRPRGRPRLCAGGDRG